MAENSAGLTISLVEEGDVSAATATGIWQNFPVKFGGQRQRSFCRQTPPFLQSRGHRTAGATTNADQTAIFVWIPVKTSRAPKETNQGPDTMLGPPPSLRATQENSIHNHTDICKNVRVQQVSVPTERVGAPSLLLKHERGCFLLVIQHKVK